MLFHLKKILKNLPLYYEKAYEWYIKSAEQGNGRLNGRHGGNTHGSNALVAAGKVAEVKHTCLDGPLDIIQHLVVRIVDQGVAFGAVHRLQTRRGGVYGLFLHIKGVNVSLLTDSAAQKLCVVAVAHGKVYRHIAGAKVGQYQLLLKIE